MSATNLTPFAALDSAYLEAAKTLLMIEQTEEGEIDIDLYACTLYHVGVGIKKMMADLEAAGAEPMDDENKMAECPAEYEIQYQMEKDQNDRDLPAHKRAGYVEKLYELHDMRESA